MAEKSYKNDKLELCIAKMPNIHCPFPLILQESPSPFLDIDKLTSINQSVLSQGLNLKFASLKLFDQLVPYLAITPSISRDIGDGKR